MPIQDMSDDQLAEFIGTAVRAAFENHPCRYRPSPERVDHVFGMVSDIGDGDPDRGVEVIRRIHTWAKKRIAIDEECMANHRFTSKLRTVSDGVLTKFLAFVLWGGLAIGLFMLVLGAAAKMLPEVVTMLRLH